MGIDISVIVPVFNTEKYLRECLDSLAGQTVFERMEVLLVDDGSADASPAICDEYAAKHPRFSVMHQENLGVSAARNAGLRMASGKYAGFVDSDDTIAADMYEKLIETAEKTGSDISSCGYIFCGPDAQKTVTFPFKEEKALTRDEIIHTVFPFMIRSDAFNSCCNKLFSLSVIRQNGIVFPEGRKHAEDRRFVIDCLMRCQTMCYSAFPGYYYRYVETGAVNAARADYLENMLAKYHENIELFGGAGLERAVLDENNALSLAEQAVSAAFIIENKLNGKIRRKTLKSLVKNGQIRACVSDCLPSVEKSGSRYDKLMYRMLQKGSAFGVRVILRAMKIRLYFVKTAAGQ